MKNLLPVAKIKPAYSQVQIHDDRSVTFFFYCGVICSSNPKNAFLKSLKDLPPGVYDVFDIEGYLKKKKVPQPLLPNKTFPDYFDKHNLVDCGEMAKKDFVSRLKMCKAVYEYPVHARCHIDLNKERIRFTAEDTGAFGGENKVKTDLPGSYPDREFELKYDVNYLLKLLQNFGKKVTLSLMDLEDGVYALHFQDEFTKGFLMECGE